MENELEYLRRRVRQLEYAAKETINFCESTLPDTECCRYLYDCFSKYPEVVEDEREYTNVGKEGHCDYEELELTQEVVNEECDKLSDIWNEKLTESGLSQDIFIATNEEGFATKFLGFYQITKAMVESLGLVMPVIVEGVEVSIDEE